MIEGFIGKLGNAYWMVRGYYTVSGRVLALPRYLIGESGYAVVKEPEAAVEIAEELAPGSIAYAECYGRKVPLLEREEFEAVLDPRRGPSLKKGRISEAAEELLRILRKEIGSEDVGVTGGLLLGKQTSDIDIVVYGKESSIRAYEVLGEESILERYTLGEAMKLLENRGQRAFAEKLVEREARKRLQGKFMGFDVYIRLVPAQPDSPVECRRRVIKAGEVRRVVEITDARMGYLYPCRYEAKDLSTGEEITVYSDRGRFCELFSEGERALVAGEREIVEEEGSTKEAVYLWRAEHFAIPMDEERGFD